MCTTTQLTTIFLALSMCFFSCKDKKDFITPGSSVGAGPESEMSIEELSVPNNFQYRTVDRLDVNLNTSQAFGLSMTNASLEVFDYSENTKGTFLMSAVTDNSGNIKLNYDIPGHVSKVLITNKVIGVPNELIFNVEYGDLVRSKESYYVEPNSSYRLKSGNTGYNYHGTYNNIGVPDYLVTSDVIDDALLSVIDNSLPEGYPVPQYNPQYIASGVESDIKLSGLADIWITFVHEGAGFRNALAYYTYDINNPPTSKEDINNLTVILPNASFSGSGGGLVAGDKVYLGQFPANTGIGWTIIANGWNGNNVGNGLGKYYSNPDFNPESSASNRNHIVILKDNVRDLLLIGFEDINRDRPNCDNDFNDLIFYVTANPYSNVITDDYEEVSQSTISDEDNDGISDANDAYPTDANKAADVYYPGEGVNGMLLYEDLWPATGDYDFNDLVMSYNYHFVTNSQNKAVELNATFTLKAIGASYKNGFAFQLNTPASNISSISGQPSMNTLFSMSNGLEDHGSKCVIPVMDDNWKYMERSGTSGFANTVQNERKVDDKTFTITIVFSTPIAINDLGTSPFDPFLVKNQNRGMEIHLPGNEPTSLADNNNFQTFNDDTKLGEGKYYLTRNNLPWALHIPYDFKHMREKVKISTGYYFFNTWAVSAGGTETDWYLNNSAKRNQVKIFDK